MMRLFLSIGVDIEHTDNQGNNVFHYVADLSAESPDRAIVIFKHIVKFITDPEIARQMLARKRNSRSLTAIEYTTKFGSPPLLNKMLNYPNILEHTSFAVSKHDYKTKLEYVDVSMYETGTIRRYGMTSWCHMI